MIKPGQAQIIAQNPNGSTLVKVTRKKMGSVSSADGATDQMKNVQIGAKSPGKVQMIPQSNSHV